MDTQTGFRAYSGEALRNISIVSDYNFAQEVMIDLKFKGYRIGEIPVDVLFDKNRKSRIVRNIFTYSLKASSTIIRSMLFHKPIMGFGLFGGVLIGLGIFAKILTISNTLQISNDLENALIILGIVSFMLGVFANIIFKRQSFTERDLRIHLREIEKSKNSNV